jgi:hypothetical protein
MGVGVAINTGCVRRPFMTTAMMPMPRNRMPPPMAIKPQVGASTLAGTRFKLSATAGGNDGAGWLAGVGAGFVGGSVTVGVGLDAGGGATAGVALGAGAL